MNLLNNKLFYLAVLTFIVKLFLFPFAQTLDADAVSRVFLSLDWLDNPRWISASGWGPFHFYLNGVFLSMWSDRVYAPVVLNIFISVLTLLPFYYFTRREFNEQGAFVATCILAASPVLFHLSFLSLSETPYLFFVVLSMNCISKALREHKMLNFVWAAVSIGVASGFRFEAWFLIPVFSLLIACFKQFRGLILFSFVAAIYPLITMYIDYKLTQNPFVGFDANSEWMLNAMATNDHISWEDYARRIWSFPFFWLIAVGPFTLFFLIKELIKSKINLWVIPFLMMALLTFYAAFKGTLMLHSRFIGTWVILSLPFVAAYFNESLHHFKRNAIVFVSTVFLLSFVYSVDHVKPVPRLKNQQAVEVVETVNENVQDNSFLLIDFWSWENSYYLALNTVISHKQIAIVDGAPNSELPVSNISKMFSESRNGLIVLVNGSKLHAQAQLKGDKLFFSFYNKEVAVEKIYEKGEVIVFKRKR